MKATLLAVGALAAAAALLHPGPAWTRGLLLASFAGASWLALRARRGSLLPLAASLVAYAHPPADAPGRALLSALLATAAGWLLLRAQLRMSPYRGRELVGGALVAGLAVLGAWALLPDVLVRSLLDPAAGGAPLAILLCAVAFLGLAAAGVPSTKRE